jgi:hypothetical protein
MLRVYGLLYMNAYLALLELYSQQKTDLHTRKKIKSASLNL